MKNAGFTPREIMVIISGKLVREGDFLRLKTTGPVPEFVLASGAKADELSGRADLLGKRVRVTGKLHPAHAEKPPGITVDAFEVAPE